MAKKTKITIKQLLKGKKVVFPEGKESAPIAIIGGMANRVFYRTTDAGAVPYLRGTFWFSLFVDGSGGMGEVCVLPSSWAASIIEKLEKGAPGVEFAYRVEVQKRAKAQVWQPLIEPRVDDPLSRLQAEVFRILAPATPAGDLAQSGSGTDGSASSAGDQPGAAGDAGGGVADGGGSVGTGAAGDSALAVETPAADTAPSGEGGTPAGDVAPPAGPASSAKKNRRLGGPAPLTVEPGQR